MIKKQRVIVTKGLSGLSFLELQPLDHIVAYECVVVSSKTISYNQILPADLFSLKVGLSNDPDFGRPPQSSTL